MLRRINRIRNVGCYQNCISGDKQFGKLTFIYGDNSYGKSTLCDIFRSISNGESQYILNRLTIPNDDVNNQRVDLSFNYPGNTTETTIRFLNSNWEQELTDLNIEVFDTDFIHRNVFTGLSIERKNQENITEFILGGENVTLASQIATDKSNLRGLNKEITNLENDTFSEIDDIVEFIGLHVNFTEEQLLGKIVNLEHEVKLKNKTLRELASISVKPNLALFATRIQFIEFTEELNLCFSNSYQRVHENATEKVLNHINDNCNKEANLDAEGWLSKGIYHITSDNCPFCSQKLEDQSLALISAYKDYFDEQFREFENSNKQLLKQLQSKLKLFSLSSYLTEILNNSTLLRDYNTLINSDEFSTLFTEILESSETLYQKITNWNNRFEILQDSINPKIEEKQSRVYHSLEEWDFSEDINEFNSLLILIRRYNDNISKINQLIDAFKLDLNDLSIQSDLANIISSIQENKKNIKRIQLSESCNRYSQSIDDRNTLKTTIENTEDELQNNQSEFITRYFERINILFSEFGSPDFSIRKTLNKRGNMPVFELTAKFKGVEITNSILSSCFSESDRRALALSIFLAKILILSNEEKRRTIAVFDDPITSFDDNRIDSTIRFLELERQAFCQFIIASHYPRYIKAFFERAYNEDADVKLLKIVKENDSSVFQDAQPADFVESLHQKKYKQIMQFIERESQDDIFSELRVYLEEEIRIRYRKQIEQYDLQNVQFSNLIERLYEEEVFTEDNKNKLNQFRISLNVPHHAWIDLSCEDKITLARNLIEHIYTEL